ncbi:DNA mismatch repair protein MutL [Vibrio ruber DSM 16370]|uniref:DNA mismatch repair protein MutL n=1 Tax=Vibrio ruber (strain DSM 16370 / JCM 11486 / BCRC 17186 / CECT 7878 / LMG 23124 / VR1) TaxID=1123498 RepID=A0A1R4LP81_VIBR1|nr:DNA mismatch repair endonuclease MutL [Vibrio ruber]SJN58411.1 DNA mismatch repair protein MutL [Vibrio ruber DSM 16370]
MTIKILPARLANQIAAGEVVERPASVVKELVENSLDSGATRIDVDIEKGGAKLIRVRDNGHGIEKDQLTLALSRHATSKIHSLDDLEAIISLGFRGEALASISSVSRLSLTSRPAMQDEAWLAYSEGRDMAVQLQPAAHPVGTTVEVLDLFFNTPARRKFLRTEKTEFTHIEEVLKRIALSRFDVTIFLKHNGKMVRQYRAAQTELQKEKRIAAVCGQPFVRHMLKVELEHQGLILHGWISTPEGARQQSDLQYCYVNGRMMKDKLINHAIRQSYEKSLSPEQYAAYVLYIELDPRQVDVNVHPAKHEVRFHQARLVHDFIYQAISSALVEGQHIDEPEVTQSAFHHQTTDDGTVSAKISPQLLDAIDKTPSYPGREKERSDATKDEVRESVPSRSWQQSGSAASSAGFGSAGNRSQAKSTSRQEAKLYQQLMNVSHETSDAQSSVAVQQDSLQVYDDDMVADEVMVLGKAVAVIQGKFLLMSSGTSCCMVALEKANRLKLEKQLDAISQPRKGQPLLVPLSLKLSQQQLSCATQYQDVFLRLGIELKKRSADTLMVMSVPQPLRQQNLQKLIPDLLSYTSCLNQNDQSAALASVTEWLADYANTAQSDYTLSQAIQLIAEVEQLYSEQLPLDDRAFVRPVDFSATITAFYS